MSDAAIKQTQILSERQYEIQLPVQHCQPPRLTRGQDDWYEKKNYFVGVSYGLSTMMNTRTFEEVSAQKELENEKQPNKYKATSEIWSS